MSDKITKKVFLICPIGEEKYGVRAHLDKLLKMLGNALNPIHYELVRADKIGDIGIITRQIINELLSADFVIADITHLNANVFYELAIRDCAKKPGMIIYDKSLMDSKKIPFDVNAVRTFYYDVDIADAWTEFQSKLVDQLQKTQSKDYTCINTVTAALDSPEYFSLEMKRYDSTLENLSKSLYSLKQEIGERIDSVSERTS
ncbi:hypothetical protein AGMMS49975_28910 [Clostridia bacterium]|nr:hypothetical protein AGMMS49975_28910 [Clostridia bacterium]